MDGIIEELLLEGENVYFREEAKDGTIIYITNFRAIVQDDYKFQFCDLENVLSYGFNYIGENHVYLKEASDSLGIWEVEDSTTCIDFIKELSRAIYEAKTK